MEAIVLWQFEYPSLENVFGTWIWSNELRNYSPAILTLLVDEWQHAVSDSSVLYASFHGLNALDSISQGYLAYFRIYLSRKANLRFDKGANITVTLIRFYI